MALRWIHGVVHLVLVCVISLSKTGGSLGSDFGPSDAEDEALFLTPYIEAGLYDEARNLSRVGPLNGTSIASFSGYLTVNPRYNANMFIWLIPALNNPDTAPLVLWLQGGPGGTSLYSLFEETGPWRITSDLVISETNYTWVSVFNVLYIDNPVGAGLSFTDSDAGYVTNEDEVARDLYYALQQFLTLFSEYQSRDFYVTGESYAGKYIPAIAYKIHEENQNAVIPINLKGIAIGNGLIDPVTQINYGDFLFNHGLIDYQQRNLFYEQENLTVQNIESGDYMEALRHFDILVVGSFVGNFSYFRNFTGLTNMYDIRMSRPPAGAQYPFQFMQLPSTMKAVHLGNHTLSKFNVAEEYLLPDIMNTTKPWLESLLDNDYKVLIYSGLVDACIPYAVTENMIRHLNWNHAEEYKDADRLIWRVHPTDVEVAGYAKKVHNFQEVAIRNAGHMVPADQPRAALDMISRFVFDKLF